MAEATESGLSDVVVTCNTVLQYLQK